MNIIKAINDKNLFKPFLEDNNNSIRSWQRWLVALRYLYGLPVKKTRNRQLIKKCTGKTTMPKNGFSTALFLIGRRSGKSRISAVCGAYEAALSGREKLLAKGELGMVAILAPTKKQGRIVKNYLRAIFEETDLLKDEIVNETQEGFLLANGVLVEILVGDWRSIRGYTLLAAIVDEVCFFGIDTESKVRSDTELIRAIKPSLATTGGRLICISSPYAKKGWGFNQYKKHFSNNNSKVLVWNCPSRTMNPTLPQSVVDEAIEEDLQAAKSEYLGEFRDDISAYLPREVIEAVVFKGRKELLPNKNERYFAFVDISGGRNDDAAFAIAHMNGRKVVIDIAKRYRPPHSPYEIIGVMCEELKRFGLKEIIGDSYSAEFVVGAFRARGVQYEKSDLPKSGLYMELLPRICSGEIELLDDDFLINQLASLERRTRSGGKDVIDHPSSGHDDLANVVAGVTTIASVKPTLTIGVF
jgi:hypothetical protein